MNIIASLATERYAPQSVFDKVAREQARAESALDKALADLAWLDIPVKWLSTTSISSSPGVIEAVGTVVHIMHQWHKDSGRNLESWRIYDVDHCTCPGRKDVVRKSRGWRHGLEGTYRILGFRDESVLLAPVGHIGHEDRIAGALPPATPNC